MKSKTFKRVLLWGIQRAEDHDGYRRGIARYVRPLKRWDLVPVPVSSSREETAGAVARTLADPPDALIGAVRHRAIARMAREAEFPIVMLFGGRRLGDIPQVGTDDEAIGRLAADYLADRGFRNFAFYGPPDYRPCYGRWFGFREALRARGHRACRCAYHTYRRRPPLDPAAMLSSRSTGVAINWISELPKPVAIFCVDDGWSLWVAEACRHLGLSVPEQVAILGVGGDSTICVESYPPLSSIALPSEQVGYQAAAVLDRLLTGKRASQAPILLPPGGVITRQSTDSLAIEDENIRVVVRFIREHAHEGIRVSDVVKEVTISRSYLERQFRKTMGRTVFEEIRRRQIEEAQRLLRETNWSQDRIARASGFSSGIRLNTEFRRNTGQTPGQYRAHFREA
jgi:LacI family transcriptional regulator, galactose operon repressor